MPISPENKARYPKDWKQIRERIRTRAGDKCEWCGVANHAIRPRSSCGRRGNRRGSADIRVVCTVAHVHDPDPANCSDDNLAFLCQRCHNRHDAPMRTRNAATTRVEKADRSAGQSRMF